VTHYDVLGVRPGASDAEIRHAYLDAARRAHPDIAGPVGEDAMRALNQAWAVLGDAEARRAYDRGLGVEGERSGPTVVDRPAEKPFVPYHEHDEDDDDTWRYVDDETDPETAPSRWVQLGPGVAVATGFVVAVLGAFVGVKELAVLGGLLVVLGVVGFVAAPLMVMAQASTVERRRAEDRKSSRPPR
jgi:hypothetical protein